MKKALAIIISLLICTLCACTPGGSPPGTMATEQTQPPTESTEVSTTAAPTTEAATEEQTTQPSETEGTHPQCHNEAASAPTRQTESTEPLPTQSAQEETKQPETQPPVTAPPTTEAATEETQPTSDPTEEVTEETTEETQPETEPEVFEPDYAFKRQVASYAAQYINQYRSSPCTVLSGMSQVAQYRAGQLRYNFSHSTADKRAALAYYEYGRWIDATLAGLDESDSYYESDTSEAICRGVRGNDAETLGKAIADAIRNSGSHWAYVGSSEFSYMGIGVEYHDGKWYACVMVGTVNYG